MSTNTLKQALEIVYGDIKNINKRVKNLESASAGVIYTETTKSAVAYQDNVSPNACPYALLNIVGSMSYKSENLCPTATYVGIMNNTISKSIDFGNLPNGTYTISLNISENTNNRNLVLYYYNNGVIDNENNIITTMTSTGAKTYTFTLDGSVVYDDIRLGINSGSNNYSITLDSLMLNKGSTALPYQPYFEGIRDSATTSVISKDSNNTALQTINIPNEIQALEGYGWGINDTCYNYIGFVNKKFIQKIERVKAKDLTWTKYGNNFYGTITNGKHYTTNVIPILCSLYNAIAWVNRSNAQDLDMWEGFDINAVVIKDTRFENTTTFKNHFTDDDYIYFELATPIETDISALLPADFNSIQIDPNGTITFENTYQQAIPYEYLYLEKVGANNE